MTPVSRKPCIHIVAGARPNFMKIAPMVRALQADGRLAWKIVHTGQHFDRNMSDVFFEELGIPAPDVHFNCGGGSHATQTARIMEAFEQHCAADRPDAVVVVGETAAPTQPVSRHWHWQRCATAASAASGRRCGTGTRQSASCRPWWRSWPNPPEQAPTAPGLRGA